MAATPRICVAVATYERPERMSRLLAALDRQDVGVGAFDVVVCDDGSSPESLAALRAAAMAAKAEVTVLVRSHGGPAGARNAAWRASSAPIVAFTDDDCQPSPDWLSELLKVAGPGKVVVGRVEPNPEQGHLVSSWSRTLRVSDTRYFQAANATYARSDLEAVGGFDDAFIGGEDTDLGRRVVAHGAEAVFAGDALVYHDVRAGTIRALAAENSRKWVDLPLVVKRHPELRDQLHSRWFWKPSHPALLAAAAGLVAATWRPAGLLLTLPWVKLRLVDSPMTRGGYRARISELPGVFIVDASEVLAVARGSVKHRTLLL